MSRSIEREALCTELKKLACTLLENIDPSAQLDWENQKKFLDEIDLHVSKYPSLSRNNTFKFSTQGRNELCKILLEREDKLQERCNLLEDKNKNKQLLACLNSVSACLRKILMLYYKDINDVHPSSPISGVAELGSTIRSLQQQIKKLKSTFEPQPSVLEKDLLNFIEQFRKATFSNEQDLEKFKTYIKDNFLNTNKSTTPSDEKIKTKIIQAWEDAKKTLCLTEPELSIRPVLEKVVSLYSGSNEISLTEDELTAIQFPKRSSRSNTSTSSSPSLRSPTQFSESKTSISGKVSSNSSGKNVRSHSSSSTGLTSPITLIATSTSMKLADTELTEEERNDAVKKLEAYYNPSSFFSFHPTISSDRKKCVKDLIHEIKECKNKNGLLEKILIAQSTIAEDDYYSDFGKPSNQIVAPAPWHHFTIKPRNVTGSRLMNLLNDILKDNITPGSVTIDESNSAHIQHLLNVIYFRLCNLENDKNLPENCINDKAMDLHEDESNLVAIQKKLECHISAFSENGTFRYQTGLLNLMKSTYALIKILSKKNNAQALEEDTISSTRSNQKTRA